MKILFLGQLPPVQHGVTKVNAYAKSVLKKKHKLDIVNLSSSDTLDDIDNLSIKKIFLTIFLFVKILNGLIRKPDIVYFSFCPSGFAFYRDVLIVFLIRLFSIKHVFHMHGQGLNQKQSALRVFLEKQAFKKAYVIHLSSVFWKELESLIPEERFFIVPNSSDDLLSGEDDKQTNASSSDTNLLYLSNYVRGKGPLYILELAEQLWLKGSKVKITMAGGWFDHKLKAEIDQWLLSHSHLVESGYLTVSGPAYDEDKSNLFQHSDIFLFPSYIDTFPLAVVEALSAGMVVVASDCGAVSEILESGRIGEVVPMHDTKAFLQSVEKLFSDPERLAVLKKASRLAYLEKYTFQKFEKNLLAVMNKVMK